MDGKLPFPAQYVFCFLFQNERVLLVKRLSPPWCGSITVPGGKRERGETPLEACVREVQEETGLGAASLRLRGIAHITSDDREATAWYYSSSRWEGDLRGSEEGLPFWADREESLLLPEVNPFYSLLAPRILDESSPLFEAKISSDDTCILASSFADLRRGEEPS